MNCEDKEGSAFWDGRLGDEDFGGNVAEMVEEEDMDRIRSCDTSRKQKIRPVLTFLVLVNGLRTKKAEAK